MAKYCIKCGKALPDGVEICPDCHVGAKPGNDAALFTMMTAETEVWKESADEERKRERAKIIRKNKQKILIGVSAVAVAAAIAVVLIFTSAPFRVDSALSSGEYDKALSIYTEKLAGEEPSKKIRNALLEAAEAVYTDFAQHELSLSDAQGAMDTLTAFGSFTGELLADVLAGMDQLYGSYASMSEADHLVVEGEYLAAADAYLAVAESDSMYQKAQEKAQECLDAYADSKLAGAGELIKAEEYIAAIELLRECDDVLFGYGTFSQAVDDKLVDSLNLYESHILTEAKALADQQDYTGAAEVVRGCVEDFGYETDALLAALESYLLQADDKLAADAIAAAIAEYEGLRYAAAFDALDAALEKLVEGEALESVERAIADMEKLFVEDICTAADEIYGGDRENLVEAIAKLERAHIIRGLDGLEEKMDELEELLPFVFAEEDYASKEGEIYRNLTSFDALDGSRYRNWLWGRDEAYIVYELEEAYDMFEATFAIRRESDESMSAYFEIWLDGELSFTSEELSHKSESLTMPVSLEVSGVNELKIVFFCGYEASSAENGYSYHGLCEAEVYKTEK